MSITTDVSLKDQGSFNTKSIRKASGWVFGGYVSAQFLRLLSNLILTRLLAPEMFGIMAIANVVVAGVQMLSDMGIQKNIIQSKKGTDTTYLDTAWVMQIFRGISLAAIIAGISAAVWFAGPSFSPESVYANPDLPLVLLILASSLIISGFRTTKSAVANRQLDMAKITAIDLSGQIISIVVMVILASNWPNVWALVAGTITSAIYRICIEYMLLPGHQNRFRFDLEFAKEIFHFGKWIFATSLLSYWVLNGDRLILGFDISAYEMGIYSIAVFIVSSLRGAINSLMQKVMYPAMSQALRESSDCVTIYYRFRLPLDLLICSLSGFLIVAGEQVIWTLYDDRYREAGTFLSFLSIGLLADRYRGLGLYYQAEGKPKQMMPIALTRAVLLAIGLPMALYEYDFFGAVVFLGIYPMLVVPLQLYLKTRAGLMNVYKEVAYTLFIIPGVAAGYFFLWAIEFFTN
ncbi:oligosaccharide flippase family protein [Microbulbifer hydrolyticus]|uniref:O-antigen/teichoic acid export membrane protein n=1 Tax=Microbulbifer hydrolyticus TaxID=48074 RepID=A0A6P1TFY3_9GAMM|nr:oligosaccharide flippase family protein [Microbulbifer hydrolyticus]MBB5211849.1 O-antigen/teichoic acid export membrane protein [Microbulbifer hydrolyticus]QHQ40563.1 oligosaccharide flippase family protein [Microbulbifer hydrolyticus]